MTALFEPPKWQLQPVEQALARLELRALTGSEPQADGAGQRAVAPDSAEELRRRLAFTRAVIAHGETQLTLEAELEGSRVSGARKSTAHALHGLHPYKGKFYPQIARALLNVCEIPTGGTVVDPFAGCGTSVIEATLIGIEGIGVDANPLAVLVANTKLRLLTYDVDRLTVELRSLVRRLPAEGNVPQSDYMRRWFTPDNFENLGRVLSGIQGMASQTAADAARVALSAILRRSSLQDPKQLRIHRRVADKVEDLQLLFEQGLETLLDDVRSVQAIGALPWDRIRASSSRVLQGDARELRTLIGKRSGSIDGVVTSPPYASALPYIDTDRLSLRAFGFLNSRRQSDLESVQVGNREITEAERRERESEFVGLSLPKWVPPTLHALLLDTVAAANEQGAGFRRRRTPALLFGYFNDMRRVLGEIASVVRPGARIAVVIGDNRVGAVGGRSLAVSTTEILPDIAGELGFELLYRLDKTITTFAAPETIHHRNAMVEEAVLVFARS